METKHESDRDTMYSARRMCCQVSLTILDRLWELCENVQLKCEFRAIVEVIFYNNTTFNSLY